MPNPNINWGGAQAVLCNVVAAFGVDNTGATDAGPALATAFADLAASGQVPWLRSGTYKVTTAAPPAAGQPVWVQPGVTFTGANAASVANVALVYGEAPGTPAYNPAWYALADIYWDPAAGNDTNTGEVDSPVRTFAEIVRRWGSETPTYADGRGFVLHKLSAQTAGTDPVFCVPNLSDGGQAVLLDTLAVVAAAFVCGAVTAKVRSGSGTLLQVAGMPVGTAANQYVYNQTRNSYAFIDSITGSHVATMQQPLKAAIITTVQRPVVTETVNEDNTWATGDTLVIYQCQSLNLKRWAPRSGDQSAGGAASLGWVQWSRIVDTSGTGASQYSHQCESGSNILSGCQVDTAISMGSLEATPLSTPPDGAMLVGCTVTGQVLASGNAVGIIGGGFADGGFVLGTFECGSDAILHGAWLLRASFSAFHSVYVDSLLTVYCTLAEDAVLYGPGGVYVGSGATYWNASGNPFAANLAVAGTLSLGNLSAAAGSYFAPGINQWVGGVTVTAANLDAYAGLTDPQTGAKFCLTNGGNKSQLTNLAALAALNTTYLLPGAQVYVQSTNSYFGLLPASSAAPNGSTIVAATGGGNWVLISAAGAEPSIDATAFGVIGDGVADDGPAFSIAATTLGGTGITLTAKKAVSGSLTPTFLVKTTILLPSNVNIESGPGATFVADVPGPLGNNTVLFYAEPSASLGTTTLAANTILGSLTCSVTAIVLSGGTIAVGKWVQLANAPIGTIYRGAFYQVLAVSGAGPFTLTLDRPIKYVFSATDTVTLVNTIPENIHFFGNGCAITGVCARYFEWVGARDCSIEDLFITDSGGAATNAGTSFDIGGYRSFYRGVRANFGGGPNWGLMIESGESCGLANCDVQNTNQSVTGVGIQLWDCVECTVDEACSASHCLVGIALVSQDAVLERGCINCQISGCYDANASYGVFFTLGTRECVLDNFTANYNGSMGVYLDGSGARMQSNVVSNGEARLNVSYGIRCAVGAKATTIANVETSDNGTFGVFCSDDTTILGLTAYDTTVPAGAGQTSQTVLGISAGYVTCTGFNLRDTQASGNFVVVMSGGTLDLSDGAIYIGGGNYGAVAEGASVLKLARVLFAPNASPAGETAAATSGANALIRIGMGVDTSNCATGITTAFGGKTNRFTQVLAGAATTVVAWPNLKATDNVQLQIQSVAGTLEAPYAITANPGTGFTITPLGAAPSLDTSTLQVLIE